MYDHIVFSCLHLPDQATRAQVIWAISLENADGHFILPQGFVCLYIS